MSNAGAPRTDLPNLPRRTFWTGYVTGTNRGRPYARIDWRENAALSATALLADQQFGASVMNLSGRLEGPSATFRIGRTHSAAPYVPLDGSLVGGFESGYQAFAGNWQTEIGGSGSCHLELYAHGLLVWLLLRAGFGL